MHRIWPTLYAVWAVVAIGAAVMISGFTPEAITRLLVLAFLLLQLAARRALLDAFPGLPPRTRFVLLGTCLAAVVEGMHMISTPVFPALRVTAGTTAGQALTRYALDLVFTLPAYLVIFSVIWWFVERYRYETFPYVFGLGLAQMLGDGGIFFFLAAPPMVVFAPYPMTNYHAINVAPFLSVRDQLPAARPAPRRRWLVIPSVIGTYLVCGAAIRVAGGWSGLVAP